MLTSSSSQLLSMISRSNKLCYLTNLTKVPFKRKLRAKRIKKNKDEISLKNEKPLLINYDKYKFFDEPEDLYFVEGKI